MPRVYRGITYRLRIRLRQMGMPSRRYYQLGLHTIRRRRQSLPMIVLGEFYPKPISYEETMTNTMRCYLDVDEIKILLGKGIGCSISAKKILGYAGLLPVRPTWGRNMNRSVPAKVTPEQREELDAAENENRERASSEWRDTLRSRQRAAWLGRDGTSILELYKAAKARPGTVIENMLQDTAGDATPPANSGGAGAGPLKPTPPAMKDYPICTDSRLIERELRGLRILAKI